MRVTEGRMRRTPFNETHMSNNNPSYKVSLFRNFRETYPVATIELGSWLCSDEFRLPIEAIRKSQNPEERRALKASLPCITPSGIFQQRNANQLIQHSGLLCIDIDGAENPHISNWEVLKQEVSSFPGLYYAGLSASGRGIFLLIKIADPQRHDVYFRAIAEDLKKQGIIVDMHCRDLARLRGASYDPHPVGAYTSSRGILQDGLSTSEYPTPCAYFLPWTQRYDRPPCRTAVITNRTNEYEHRR